MTTRRPAPAIPTSRPRPSEQTAEPLDPGHKSDLESRIYASVFEGVMNQRLTPGTKLPEVALCELFGASRGTVRKVLQALAHDHIVELQPNRGARVAAPSPQETHQIFEARREVEASLVRLAVKRASDEDLASLRSHIAEEHEALHRLTLPAWQRLASTFHLRLAAVAGNDILQGYLSELMSRCSLIVALYEQPGRSACEHSEHAAIVDHLVRRDAEGAVRLMDAHLLDLERAICLDSGSAHASLARMLGLTEPGLAD